MDYYALLDLHHCLRWASVNRFYVGRPRRKSVLKILLRKLLRLKPLLLVSNLH